MSQLAAGEKEYYDAERLFAQCKVNDAIEALRQGLSQNPDHPWCNSLLGSILGLQGQMDEAEQHLRRAVELSQSTDPGIVRNLALFLLDFRSDPVAAENALRTSLTMRPHGMTFAVLGYVLEREGKAREARANYLESIRRPIGVQTATQDVVFDEWYAIAMAGFFRTSQALTLTTAIAVQPAPESTSFHGQRLTGALCWLFAAGMLAMTWLADLADYVRVVLVLGATWLVSAPPLLPRLLRLSVTREGVSAEMEPRPRFPQQRPPQTIESSHNAPDAALE